MLELLTTVWQDERAPLFEQRVRETVDWLLREMVAPAAADGLAGFAATIDAASEGEEGRFYVCTEAEIDALLGAEATRFQQVYDVGPEGSCKGRTILKRLAGPALVRKSPRLHSSS